MILPIIHYPHPVLKVAALPIERVDDRIRQLASDMLETMKNADGVGLAAPQVAESLRMIAVCWPKPDGKPGDPRVLVNPKLTLSKEKVCEREGCLSFPKLYAEVRRSRRVTLHSEDLDGNKIIEEVEGYGARVLQHEMDHLDGALFIDRMGPAAKFSLREGLVALEQEASNPKVEE